MSRLHVFDTDGTLLPRTTASMEIAKVHGGSEWLEALKDEFRLGEMPTASFSQALHAGWSELTVEDVALAFEGAPKLEGIRPTVDAIHTVGDLGIVITMSPDFFVRHWLSYGFDDAIGSRFPAPPSRQPLAPDGVLTFEDKPRIAAKIDEPSKSGSGSSSARRSTAAPSALDARPHSKIRAFIDG